jgi:uncharacterized protein (TIGR02145 family)
MYQRLIIQQISITAMKKFLFLLLFRANPIVSALSQVSINSSGSQPNNSAMLDVSSTTKGMLVPRMTTSEVQAIYDPADGLIVYCTTDHKFYAFISSENKWKEILVGTTTILPPLRCGIDMLNDTRDGNNYTTVSIGTQCWMAENLAYLPEVSPPSVYSDADPYYYVYGYSGTEVAAAKATANYTTYGVLYNWSAAMNGSASSSDNPSGVRGVCPVGWHLPSDAEWKQLEIFLGLSPANAEIANWRGTHAPQLKTIGGWYSNNGTNTSGFSALPGGCRHTTDPFNGYIGTDGYWWSSTEDLITSSIWFRDIYYNYPGVFRGAYPNKDYGFSVRCIKD